MKELLIHCNRTIKDALKQLTKGGEKCLIVIDVDEKFLGTFSDGDLRKTILKGTEFNTTIDSFYNKNSTYVTKGKYSIKEVKALFLKHKFDLIPVINDSGEVEDILFWERVFENEKTRKLKSLSVPVVIMAGGEGTRLEPFTKVLPKPLIPIHEKPIIEHIISRFTNVGCDDFYITVNYKSRILKAYFEELQPYYKVNFIDEQEPLGTAGSLKFLEGSFEKPFFVINCDIIIEVDYTSLHEFHNQEKNDITLVASAKEYIIPYGTCELNSDGHLSHINEKPKYDYLINTGLYILNPDILSFVPKNKFYNMTQLIEDAKNQGKKVGVFPIDDDAWIDVGQWAEYQKVVDKI